MRNVVLFVTATAFGPHFEAAAMVSGVVVTVKLAPVAGATIKTYRPEKYEARMRRLLSAHPDAVPTATATTDANGRFSMDGRAPVVHMFIQSPAGAAAELEASANDDVGRVVLPTATARSMIVTAKGQPVANATVAMGSFVTHSDVQGRFVLPSITSGELLIAHPDYSVFQTVTGPGNPDLPQTFEMRPGVVVSGVAQDEKFDPAKGAVVWIRNLPLATTSDDGKFVIRHAREDWNSATVMLGKTAGSMSQGDAPETGLTHGRSLNGQIIDEKDAPLRDASVTVWGGDIPFNAITDSNGSFTFDAVRPGRYRLSIDHPRYLGEYQVNIPGEEDVRMVFTAFQRSTVYGTLLDEEHKPVAGATVWSGFPYSPGAGGVSIELTASDGTFSLRRMGGNSVTIMALKQGYVLSTARDFKLTPGEPLHGVKLTLLRGFETGIDVVDEKGAPVRYATVLLDRWMDEAGEKKEGVRCPEEDPSECFTAEADGRVTVRIVPGKYDIRVEGYDMDPKWIVGADFSSGDAAKKIVVHRTVKVVTPPDTMQRPAAAEVRPGRVEGRVFEKGTGLPVTDFRASLAIPGEPAYRPGLPSGPAQEQHSGDGKFAIDGVSFGVFDVVVRAPGYITGRRSGVKIDAGRTTDGIEVELTRGVTLRGRVRGAGNAPLAGVAVSLEEFGNLRTDGTNRATTDAQGQFVLEGLLPGPKTLVFEAEGYARTARKVAAESDAPGVDVQMSRARIVSGRLVDDAGNPVAGAHIRARGGLTSDEAISDATGSFRLDLVGAETYTLTAQKEDFLTGSVPNVEGATAQDLRIVLSRGGTVTGRIVGLRSSDTGNIRVTVQGDLPFSGRVDAAGGFSVKGIPDGSFGVYATGPGVQTAVERVTVSHGAAPPLELLLISGAALHGRVSRGGNPLARATVHVSGAGGVAAEALTKPDGTYEIRDLPPGDYNVFVAPGDAVGAMGVATPISVSPSGAVFDRDFSDVPMRGRVVDSAGQPIRDATVSFSGVAGSNVISTGADGRFQFEHVLEAETVVVARRIGYATTMKRVDLTRGNPADIELTLTAVQPTLVRVVDARTGGPVDATVIVDGGPRAMIASSHENPDERGANQLWLPPGQYELIVGARGHVSQNVKVSVPAPPIEVRLTRAGSLNVTYSGSAAARAELVDASGKSARTIFLSPGRTSPIADLADGPYELRVLDAAGRAVRSYPVQIAQGEEAQLLVQ